MREWTQTKEREEETLTDLITDDVVWGDGKVFAVGDVVAHDRLTRDVVSEKGWGALLSHDHESVKESAINVEGGSELTGAFVLIGSE